MTNMTHEEALRRLIEVIGRGHPVAEGEIAEIASAFTLQSFRRKESLLQAGETARHVHFVVQGALHMYYADEKGQTHSCHFFMPGELATDLESFSKQLPASNDIEALAPTDCLFISCKDAMALMERSPAFNKYVIDTVEAVATQNINRTKDLLALPPAARYQKLLDTRPEIIQLIPQKHIARFLGMSPESLSRIRNRIVR